MSLSIHSWNVNGIRAVEKKGAIQSFIAAHQPDILGLQETKAMPEQLSKAMREPEGYHAFYHSGQRKGYSGVALWCKTKPDAVSTGLGDERLDGEGRLIRADFGPLSVMSIYFPNGQSNEERLAFKLAYYDAYLAYANRLVKEGRQLVVMGDYNTAHHPIDLARPKENETTSGFLPIERAWMDRYVGEGYHDTFRMFEPGPDHYSWWSMQAIGARERNVGWRIDYHFVSDNLKDRVKGAAIHPGVMGSDHCPVEVRLDIE